LAPPSPPPPSRLPLLLPEARKGVVKGMGVGAEELLDEVEAVDAPLRGASE